jgi:multidrug efflux pump subunit AcrA (membrane-fusion protein)
LHVLCMCVAMCEVSPAKEGPKSPNDKSPESSAKGTEEEEEEEEQAEEQEEKPAATTPKGKKDTAKEQEKLAQAKPAAKEQKLKQAKEAAAQAEQAVKDAEAKAQKAIQDAQAKAQQLVKDAQAKAQQAAEDAQAAGEESEEEEEAQEETRPVRVHAKAASGGGQSRQTARKSKDLTQEVSGQQQRDSSVSYLVSPDFTCVDCLQLQLFWQEKPKTPKGSLSEHDSKLLSAYMDEHPTNEKISLGELLPKAKAAAEKKIAEKKVEVSAAR